MFLSLTPRYINHAVVLLYMSLTRRALSKMAFCTTRLGANNYISISAKDVKTLDIDYNESVRVLLVRADLSRRDFKPRDRATYSTTLAKSDQVLVPKDVREKMDIETGDLLKYLLIPGDTIPGVEDGPIRSSLESVFDRLDTDPQGVDGPGGRKPGEVDKDRPERETEIISKQGVTMENTGQIRIGKKNMEKLGLLKGDTVNVTVQNPETGETTEDLPLEVGSGTRVTVGKATRESMGLEEPDRPKVNIFVKVPESVPEA